MRVGGVCVGLWECVLWRVRRKYGSGVSVLGVVCLRRYMCRAVGMWG